MMERIESRMKKMERTEMGVWVLIVSRVVLSALVRRSLSSTKTH
jgi:hypothetical protein